MNVWILNSYCPVMVLQIIYFHLIHRWVEWGSSLNEEKNHVLQMRRKSPMRGDDTTPAGLSTEGQMFHYCSMHQSLVSKLLHLRVFPTMPLNLCLHSGIHERKLMVLLYWLLQIHKLLFFINIYAVFSEVREPGWRNQAPKTRDRCLNPWFTSDDLQLGHADFEVIHYICISSVGGELFSMICMTLLNPDRW